MLSELDWFFFSFVASNQVWPVPLSRLLTGAGTVMGTAPAFRYTQLEEPEAASAISPSAFMASRRLALAAPGDQA